MSKLRLLFILLLTSQVIFGQIVDYKNSIDTCNCEQISFDQFAVNSIRKDSIMLPIGWKGSFKGELPLLLLKKFIPEDTIYFRASIAWDVMYTPNNQFLDEKNDTLYDEVDTLMIEGFNFLLATEKNYRYNNKYHILKLMYHEDNGKGTDNAWMWTFTLLNPKRKIPNSILCEIKAIIKQFVVNNS